MFWYFEIRRSRFRRRRGLFRYVDARMELPAEETDESRESRCFNNTRVWILACGHDADTRCSTACREYLSYFLIKRPPCLSFAFRASRSGALAGSFVKDQGEVRRGLGVIVSQRIFMEIEMHVIFRSWGRSIIDKSVASFVDRARYTNIQSRFNSIRFCESNVGGNRL